MSYSCSDLKAYSQNELSLSKKKGTGIKMVDNNKNNRISDIFNLNLENSFKNSKFNLENKQKIILLSEKAIDAKLRVKNIYI